jgi:hypothetical protein
VDRPTWYGCHHHFVFVFYRLIRFYTEIFFADVKQFRSVTYTDRPVRTPATLPPTTNTNCIARSDAAALVELRET